jgi:hypothetical protein
MRHFFRKIGTLFIKLKQKRVDELRQTVLLVDGSFILPNNFALIVRGVKDKFKNAKISILAFKDKEALLKDNFPEVDVIVPDQRNSKYPLASGLSRLLLLRRFNFIVLSSLDATTVMPSLLMARCRVFLHNRWHEWYSLRWRSIRDILTGRQDADKKREGPNIDLKDMVKSIGRIFVILDEFKDTNIKFPLLVIDNGYTDIGHTTSAVRKALENFMNPEITVITFTARRHYYVDMFPQVKVISLEDRSTPLRLIKQMYMLHMIKFERIVFTSLDILPVIMSFFVMRRGGVLLYNIWHQWWSLNFRNPVGYIPNFFVILISLPFWAYLVIASSFILVITNIRLGLQKIGFKSWGSNRNEYKTA